ncbi:hypothetical protein ACFOZ0_05010 [Streptomyces yaanensis]|uniref:Secreted protein n=1 Tax=Streptomyces yaanensis TaxID=1142239 RepID=A0ABV7S820_9ACTN|nr:hypothetical protein [Streptomyces sp. CGMCC 4.7035]WNC00207.1 hypothetical protein Q2K21_20230 [Streptomyces sp. CGMCC 4.7035]
MSHTVPALGIAMVTASGCVWYLPALADLRAGADRPVSRRTAAAACLSGWSTTGVVAVLLLLAEAWWMPGATAVTGAAVTVGLRARAAVQRRREVREAARHWAELRHGSPLIGTDRTRNVFTALMAFGLIAAGVTAAVLVATGPDDGLDRWVVAAVPALVVALFLTAAITYTRRPAGNRHEQM